MNDHETDRIAGAMHLLRPDWPTQQIRTLIRDKLADRPRRDVAVALAWIACESGTSNPYRVLETGPWWTAAAVDGQTTGRREPFDATRFCGTCNKPNDIRHPGDHPFTSVITERRAGPVQPELVASRVERMREDIHEAKTLREPEPELAKVPNPNVDRLRQATAAPVPDTHAATSHDTEGAHT